MLRDILTCGKSILKVLFFFNNWIYFYLVLYWYEMRSPMIVQHLKFTKHSKVPNRNYFYLTKMFIVERYSERSKKKVPVKIFQLKYLYILMQKIKLNILSVQQNLPLQKDNFSIKNAICRASLVAQWLGICLPMQGTRVRALVWEDPTCCGATRPVSHNY